MLIFLEVYLELKDLYYKKKVSYEEENRKD